VPVLGAWMFNSIYKFPAYQFNCQTVLTNTTWVDAYRGAGRPEATFGIERIMDDLAAELGMDPLELRERNWITHEEFPFTSVAGMTYDSGNYEAATARAKVLFGYDALRAEQKQRRESGDPVQLGIGVSTFTEMCGLAPSRVLGSLSATARAAGRAPRSGCCRRARSRSSRAPARTARDTRRRGARSSPTASACHSRTSRCCTATPQIAYKGLDTYGSRSLVVGGEAVVRAADKVIEKAKAFAAHLLEANPDDLEFKAGRYEVKGTEAGIGITEVALATFASHNYPEGMEPGIDADATFDPDNFSFPHGTHLCAVEVDTETGQSRIRTYACVDDVGHIINPLIVEGQVHGGLVQGIAQALWEEAVFDENGTLVTGSFVDYTLPTAADTISFLTENTTSPSTTNTLGTKGVGEAGTIASTPAVVNAILDAVRHLGVQDVVMPCTPERVWKAIQGASAAAETTAEAQPHFDADAGNADIGSTGEGNDQ
jgi:carbon-monoxide dehydrogenase large subunit